MDMECHYPVIFNLQQCMQNGVLTIAQGIVILQSHLKTFKNPQQYSIYNTTYIPYIKVHICVTCLAKQLNIWVWWNEMTSLL